jgi:hypothetical protein
MQESIGQQGLAVNPGIFAPISLRTGRDVDIRHSNVVKRVAFW